MWAIAIAAFAAATALGHATFSASITDASGYVAQAQGFVNGAVQRPVPLQLIPAVRNSGAATSALGYRAGPISGTEVPIYPLGLPLFMAAAALVGGDLAPHAVAPLAFGALILCAFLLGRELGGDAAGICAALFIAANPVGILYSVYPMSDVPAAACWAGVWYLAARSTSGAALTAGTLVTAATLIRPNLAPLALVPAVVLLRGCLRSAPAASRYRPVLLFGVAGLVGPALLLAFQAAINGSGLQPGYSGWETFFKASNISDNIRTYPRMFVAVFGYWPFIGLAFAAFVHMRRPASSMARTLTYSGLAMAALNVALYIAYIPYDYWGFLRFLLPAIVVILVLAAVGVTGVVSTLWPPASSRRLALAIPIAVVLVAWPGRDELAFALSEWISHARIPKMGLYLKEVLPPQAVALAFLHGGAISHYTGHNVVSVEGLDRSKLEVLIADLERNGCHPVFVVDEALEESAFQAAFPTSTFARLDWPPRAIFVGTTRIRYFVAADRARFIAGERWPIDVLR